MQLEVPPSDDFCILPLCPKDATLTPIPTPGHTLLANLVKTPTRLLKLLGAAKVYPWLVATVLITIRPCPSLLLPVSPLQAILQPRLLPLLKPV